MKIAVDQWQYAEANLPEQTMYVEFRAIRGNGYQGDIALDDITLYSDVCTGIPPTPVPPGMILTDHQLKVNTFLCGISKYIPVEFYMCYTFKFAYGTMKCAIIVPVYRSAKIVWSQISRSDMNVLKTFVPSEILKKS